MFRVAPLCRSVRRQRWIHADDRELLTDPLPALGPETRATARPADGRTTVDRAGRRARAGRRRGVEVAGLGLRRRSTRPGTHPGSVMSAPTTPLTRRAEVDQVVFSGDVLFAGSIGRTDLPGGDHAVMLQHPARPRCCRCPTPRSCCRATGRRPRWPGSGPATRTCRPDLQPEGASREPSQAAVRLSRVHPRAADRRAAGAGPAAGDLRAARVRLDRDPGGRADGPAGQAGRDRQGGLRRPPAARRAGRRDGRARPALRPDRAVRPVRPGERRTS